MNGVFILVQIVTYVMTNIDLKRYSPFLDQKLIMLGDSHYNGQGAPPLEVT